MQHLIAYITLFTLLVAAFFGAGGTTQQAQALNNGLALTPPMGWNSWNNFGCNVSDTLIRGMVDAMVTSGMQAAGYQYVNIDDCIGCDQCSMACPVDCITIDTIKSTPDVDLGLTSKNTKKRLYVPRFDIDIAKCCYCGLCVWPCPTDCIVMTDVYEFSEFDRKKLIYSFSNMSTDEIAGAQERLKKYDEEQAAKKAAVKAAAPITPPSSKPESSAS